ncbi:hypothetical protein JFL47_09470 [Haemophilus haemoglobinophilus]|nr:hypothetical protein [Canicola haemoglobinophilus]
MWFEIYLDNERKWRWRLYKSLSSGDDVIATSHQGHLNKRECETEVQFVKLTNAFTPIRYTY